MLLRKYKSRSMEYFSPPRGRFSHLAMFRLGSLLFVPAYLSVILYRPFASANDDGNFFVMAGKMSSVLVV